jgi:hypothetical protein
MKKIVLLTMVSLKIALVYADSRIINATPGKITVHVSGGGFSTNFDIDPSKFADGGFLDQLTINGLSSPIKEMHLIKDYDTYKDGYFVIYLENPTYLTIDEAKAAGISIPVDKKQMPIIKPGSGKLAVKFLSMASL